jgi:hypothetical protein
MLSQLYETKPKQLCISGAHTWPSAAHVMMRLPLVCGNIRRDCVTAF